MKENLNFKSIIDIIIARFMEIMDISPYKPKVDNFIRTEFIKSLEKVENQIKPNINFITDEQELKILNDYVFENLQNHADQIGQQLRQELQRGLLNKETPQQLKKRVKDLFKDTTYTNRLKTVLRTEKLRANNYGALSGAKQAEEVGIKLKKYLDVSVDNRTSNICMREHAKYGDKSKAIPLNEPFEVTVDNKKYSAQSSPFHPNCRTVIRFVRFKE